MMTSAQVVETSVTTTDNSPSQDYTHPDDQTTLLHVTPGFKPFTVIILVFFFTSIMRQVGLSIYAHSILDNERLGSFAIRVLKWCEFIMIRIFFF